MRVLVVNAGSSSLKLRLLGDDDALLGDRELPASRGRFDEERARAELTSMGSADAVGHRIVHGGPRYDGPVVLDESVETYLRSLTSLAPLHQPVALEAVALARRALPGVPAVACFDTAFHHGLPASASTYALPAEWRERHGLRRYGFHGLSHAYAAGRAASLLGVAASQLRVVVCHLGAGASLCAVRGGVSVDTTMGFTPLEGLVMATRAGSVDPGLVLWLQQEAGISAAELNDALEHRSGLLGLAGTADMREVLAAIDAGHGDARLALDVYVHRLRSLISAMAAAMDGLDALVFTGGIGEHAPRVRALAADGLSFLGVQLDSSLNATTTDDALVSPPSAPVPTLVVHAREDLEVARQVRTAIA